MKNYWPYRPISTTSVFNHPLFRQNVIIILENLRRGRDRPFQILAKEDFLKVRLTLVVTGVNT